jgi:hypothetical protein
MHRFYPKIFLSALLTKLLIARVEDESAMHEIVIYTTREEGKAFVHTNCIFGHDAQRYYWYVIIFNIQILFHKIEFQLCVTERE